MQEPEGNDQEREDRNGAGRDMDGWRVHGEGELMVQLFRVYTKEDLAATRTGVKSIRYVGWMEWEWVRVGREKPVAPYPWLIRDYHRLPE
jgi:hypothetical protein